MRTEKTVYLITGAIGAGKTTFAKRLLALLKTVEYIGADFYFFHYFKQAKKAEQSCYDDAKEFCKYKIRTALQSGTSFVLEKTFYSDDDFAIFDLISHYNYHVITFFIGVDRLDILNNRATKRGDDGWYYVPEQKIARFWLNSNKVFNRARRESDAFYAIDTSDQSKIVFYEEHSDVLVCDISCPWMQEQISSKMLINKDLHSEDLPLFEAVQQILSKDCRREKYSILDSMEYLRLYVMINDKDMSQINEIKSTY